MTSTPTTPLEQSVKPNTAPRPLPDALVRLLQATTVTTPPAPSRPGPLRRGDLRFVTASGHQDVIPRLVLVLSVDHERHFAQVAFVHPYPELACHLDAYVTGELVGTTFPIIVQTDLRGVVWADQCGAVVGRLSETHIAAVSRVVTEGDVEGGNGIHVGSRLAGIVDPRWSHKRSEGEALRALAADCTAVLLSR